MDLHLNGALFVANVASTSSEFLGQISPVLYLIGGVIFGSFVAIEILDTIAYNRTMRRAKQAEEEFDRLMSG